MKIFEVSLQKTGNRWIETVSTDSKIEALEIANSKHKNNEQLNIDSALELSDGYIKWANDQNTLIKNRNAEYASCNFSEEIKEINNKYEKMGLPVWRLEIKIPSIK
jgi:hypothetical protein